MKKLFWAQLLILVIHSSLKAQIVQTRFYYLEHPISNIFSAGFLTPDGKGDPNFGPSNTTITDEDLMVRKSSLEQSFKNSSNKILNIFYNTWGHNKNLEVSAKFFKVKSVTLKDEAWAKINDNLYHVVEALRADSVIFTIKKSTGDTAGSSQLEKIAGLFIGKTTVVGNILTAFAPKDSTAKGTKSLLTINSSSKDSISFTLSDSTVYYAARYAMVGQAKDNVNIILGVFKGKITAPQCATLMKRNPPPIVEGSMEGRTIYPFINPACDLDNELVKMNFVYDPKNNLQSVFVIRQAKNQVVSSKKTSAQVYDTIFVSEPIDFANELKGSFYHNTFRFVSSQIVGKNNVQNRLVVCDLEFSFDTVTKRIQVTNFDRYYHTCVYYQNADIKFFPK